LKCVEVLETVYPRRNQTNLNILSDKYVVEVITLGYANEKSKARPRKKLEELVHYENW